jgi:hypothetical protein
MDSCLDKVAADVSLLGPTPRFRLMDKYHHHVLGSGAAQGRRGQVPQNGRDSDVEEGGMVVILKEDLCEYENGYGEDITTVLVLLCALTPYPPQRHVCWPWQSGRGPDSEWPRPGRSVP